jgi:hypothetical protein
MNGYLLPLTLPRIEIEIQMGDHKNTTVLIKTKWTFPGRNV